MQPKNKRNQQDFQPEGWYIGNRVTNIVSTYYNIIEANRAKAQLI